MEEHFNEKYVESDKFPKSTFVGQIQNWDDFICKGKLTSKVDISLLITYNQT